MRDRQPRRTGPKTPVSRKDAENAERAQGQDPTATTMQDTRTAQREEAFRSVLPKWRRDRRESSGPKPNRHRHAGHTNCAKGRSVHKRSPAKTQRTQRELRARTQPPPPCRTHELRRGKKRSEAFSRRGAEIAERNGRVKAARSGASSVANRAVLCPAPLRLCERMGFKRSLGFSDFPLRLSATSASNALPRSRV